LNNNKKLLNPRNVLIIFDGSWLKSNNTSGADAINISGLLNPKKLGNFKNLVL